MQYSLITIGIVSSFAVRLWGAEPLDAQLKKLVSPVASEHLPAENWLKTHRTEVITQLLEQIKHGEQNTQLKATNTLLLVVSPWQRGIERGQRHHGFISLFCPARPAERPVSHPQAAQVRKALLAHLISTRQTLKEGPSAKREFISALTKVLAEVADESTALEIRKLLEVETDFLVGESLTHCLETIYALPTFYQASGLCGTGLTPDRLNRYKQRESEKFAQKKQELLDWMDQHAGQSLEKRNDAAVELWIGQYNKTAMYYFSRSSDLTIFRLARLGESGLKSLRRQQARETTILGRALFEIPVAAISGQVDDTLFHELIDPKHLKDSRHHEFACDILVMANSRDYLDELTSMLANPRYHKEAVTSAIASIYRTDALPLLRKQPESNDTARYAVKELELWGE